jgi:hypothetical protein
MPRDEGAALGVGRILHTITYLAQGKVRYFFHDAIAR